MRFVPTFYMGDTKTTPSPSIGACETHANVHFLLSFHSIFINYLRNFDNFCPAFLLTFFNLSFAPLLCTGCASIDRLKFVAVLCIEVFCRVSSDTEPSYLRIFNLMKVSAILFSLTYISMCHQILQL